MTVEHVAGIAVRHPVMVARAVITAARWRRAGRSIQSKGGTECTVKIAKADLVPAEANLREEYASFGELEAACEQFCDRVNGRVHRESAAVPAHRLAAERARLHAPPG